MYWQMRMIAMIGYAKCVKCGHRMRDCDRVRMHLATFDDRHRRCARLSLETLFLCLCSFGLAHACAFEVNLSRQATALLSHRVPEWGIGVQSRKGRRRRYSFTTHTLICVHLMSDDWHTVRVQVRIYFIFNFVRQNWRQNDKQAATRIQSRRPSAPCDF